MRYGDRRLPVRPEVSADVGEPPAHDGRPAQPVASRREDRVSRLDQTRSSFVPGRRTTRGHSGKRPPTVNWGIRTPGNVGPLRVSGFSASDGGSIPPALHFHLVRGCPGMSGKRLSLMVFLWYRFRRVPAPFDAAVVSLVMLRPSVVPPARPPTFVGSTSCKGCHPQEYELWQGSHHALAMQPADATTVLGNFANATFTKDGVTSTFLRREGRYAVQTDGPDGTLRALAGLRRPHLLEDRAPDRPRGQSHPAGRRESVNSITGRSRGWLPPPVASASPSPLSPRRG